MSRSRTLRTPAIILKRRDLGEADRLLTLLTPERGKVNVVAKGARKLASKKTGHVELFTRADVLIARGRDLDILTQAEVTEPYLAIREDLGRGSYANYVVELLDRFTFEAEDNARALFSLLDTTLAALCSDPDPRRVVRFYEMHLLNQSGFRPELNECVITHEILLPEDQYFSFVEGGAVSPEGARHTGALATLPLATFKLLRHLQRSQYKQVASLAISEEQHRHAERIMLGYITHTLESQLQSVDFIHQVRALSSA